MSRNRYVVCFSLFFYCFCLVLVLTSGLESELRSLLEFKKGIETDPLGKVKDTWTLSSVPDLNSSCPLTWHGVTCDATTDAVTGIALDRLGLIGNLKFSTILTLSSLQNLSLSGNRFRGRLVPALGSMSSLQHLDLSDNSFSGPISGRIADLWNLKYLNLSKNGFDGGFPVGLPVSFRNLQQLRVLDLHCNKIRGNVGELFSELINLEYLDLSGNQFYGGLRELSADNVSGLANTIRFVNLSGNVLDGGFMRSEVISMFRRLEVLDLGDNAVNGELPAIGVLSNLRVLRLGRNQLFGTIPEELLNGSMPIEELDLSCNGFTGYINTLKSSTLNVLNLSSNSLSGTLPSYIGSCSVVDLSRNMIDGDMSVLQYWGDTLEILDLSSNKLSGNLPNLTSQFVRLSKLSLRNNSIEGELAQQLESTQSLSDVDLSLNEFTGLIPRNFFTSITLKSLNLSRNQFSGQIQLQGSSASELLIQPSSNQLESLDLSYNSLNGILSSGIGNLLSLTLLNLSNNALSGQLPTELSKLTFLRYLDLSGNRFHGEIPDGLPSSLVGFNVSNNNLSGRIPEYLKKKFDISSFRPGNLLLDTQNVPMTSNSVPDQLPGQGKHHSSKGHIVMAIIISLLGTVAIMVFVLIAYKRVHSKEFVGRNEPNVHGTEEDDKAKRSSRSLFNFQSGGRRPPTSLSFSHDHLLTLQPGSSSGQQDFATEIVERNLPKGVADSSTSAIPNLLDIDPIATTSGRKSSPGSPLSSSPRFVQSHEPVVLDVYSPDRLAGDLLFLDASLTFTAAELSHAPAEVLGRSSHGTLYKATLDSGHMLTVKWLRVGLVKHKKEFAKEVKKIGSIRHPNLVLLRAYYWGPREQERLLLADYIEGDSLALHLYETTPRKYSLLSFTQRLKVAVDVARCLLHLHDRGMLHGNLKPSNILLEGPEYNVRLSDYGLHRLMTPAGIAEQILNLGALGYCAPELASTTKPAPSFKGDVYTLGVILMELVTRRSAGDIVSGMSGAVDLTDWVRLCDQEGRRMECLDSDISGSEESSKGMDDMLVISLRCILPVNERPNIRQVLDDLNSVSV